ncbi:MAG: hypothetical protein K2N87_18250 [Eubacterium sp.]|nr:hypothetical protein [Eubacterium sp.]
MDENQKEEQSISINDVEYLPVTRGVKESMRVQKTEYIRQQMLRRQENEDALMAQLLEEQRVIDGLQKKINENLEQTEEASKYNKEFQESMNAQIYALHGISEDKLEGMREYKNAYYQGCAFSLFLLSAALIILCGALHGFASEICVFMLAYTGIEGALLTQEHKRPRPVAWLCRLLYLLMFPAMMVMFVCYELKYPEYGMFMPYAVAAGIGVLIFATLSYFLYNPYHSMKKKVREAKEHIEDIEKIAKKEVRKNQNKRRKEEKKLHRQLAKEDRQQQRRIRKKLQNYAQSQSSAQSQNSAQSHTLHSFLAACKHKFAQSGEPQSSQEQPDMQEVQEPEHKSGQPQGQAQAEIKLE